MFAPGVMGELRGEWQPLGPALGLADRRTGGHSGPSPHGLLLPRLPVVAFRLTSPTVPFLCPHNKQALILKALKMASR